MIETNYNKHTVPPIDDLSSQKQDELLVTLQDADATPEEKNEAFSLLYAHFYWYLYHYGLSNLAGNSRLRVSTAEEVEERVQETLYKLYLTTQKLKKNSNLNAVVFRMYINGLINYLTRDLARQEPFPQNDLEEDSEDDSEEHFLVDQSARSPEEILVEIETIEELMGLVKQLLPEYQLLLQLRFIDEKRYDSIAEEFYPNEYDDANLNEVELIKLSNKLKSRMNRIITALRKELGVTPDTNQRAKQNGNSARLYGKR